MNRSDLPHYIEDPNLSVAWARAFLAVRQHGEIPCLTVSITGFADARNLEDNLIRKLLDAALSTGSKQDCHAVANTVFPSSLWNPLKPAEALFGRYKDIAFRVRRRHKANQWGTYFERMISYGSREFNQLRYILDTWSSGNHRRSALQVLVLYPQRDDTNQRRRGFPCLSQVSFTHNDAKELIVTGYYPMQTMFDRAYGNYLGLARLGEFMAHELHMELVRINSVATVAARGCTVARSQMLADSLTDQLVALGVPLQ